MDDREPRERPEDQGIPDLDPTLPAKEATGDAQEGVVLPGDEPRAAEEHGTTAEEQRGGEDLDARLNREEPDRDEPERRRSGRLIEDGEGLTDDEKDEVAEEAPNDTQGLSAEEAAVRVDEDARGGTDGSRDRYVEEP